MKPTTTQKKQLARSMNLETWQLLCGSNVFDAALKADIGQAQAIAEIVAMAADPRAELARMEAEHCAQFRRN